MKKQPLISIIMNCYNGEEFLKDALESVKAQTYKNWELIFWDNQSNDKSAEVFKMYDDQRFKYFYAPTHSLLSEARNYAIEESTGEFLAFLDVDDWWNPDKLEKQIPLFEDQDVGLVYANYWYVVDTKNIKFPAHNKTLPTGWCMDELLINYCIGLLTIIVRSKIIKNLNQCFNTKYFAIEDFDFVLNLAKSWKIDCVQNPLAFFRHHDNNNSFILKDKRIAELREWCDIVKYDNFIGKKNGLKYLRKMLDYQEATIHLERCDYNAAWKCAKKLNLSTLQIRLLMKLFIPDLLYYRTKLLLSKYFQ